VLIAAGHTAARAVEARDLQMSFLQAGTRVDVLDIASLAIPQGALYGVEGPSGCGKTTLLHLCAGLLQPTGGQLLVQGTSVRSLGQRERDLFRAGQIGYVFQSFNLIPALSALENVMLPMGFSKRVARHERRSRAQALLQRVGLGHRLEHRPAALSHGEMQRVGIARALANEPPMLLADEPTASLEARRGGAVVDLLIEVARETGATLLLASHDERVLAKLDRVLEMALENRVARASA
jgi:putative ABC transport system ATP-binding protein